MAVSCTVLLGDFMTFEEYLKFEMDKPVKRNYDPDGNSTRAIVQRGLYKETIKQYRYIPERGKSLLREVDGLTTPIGLMIAVPFFILFFPVLPILWGVMSHSGALQEYRAAYDRFHST